LLAPAAMAARKRALVVDDEEPIRVMLSRVVARNDFDVDMARDGAEAIKLLERDAYDVILLDLMMPRVSGFEVLRHMSEHHPDQLGRTIIASAIPETELRQLSVPVFRVHSKPFDMTALVEDIRKVA
jgi:two-component system response regulator PilR (NtrC family)